MSTIHAIIDVQIPGIQVDGVQVGREVVETRQGLDINKVGNLAIADLITRLKALPASELQTETLSLLANLDTTQLVGNVTRKIRLVIINNLNVLFNSANNTSSVTNFAYDASVDASVVSAITLPRTDNYIQSDDLTSGIAVADGLPRYDNYLLSSTLVFGGLDSNNATSVIRYGNRNETTPTTVVFVDNIVDVSQLPQVRALEGNMGIYLQSTTVQAPAWDLTVGAIPASVGEYEGTTTVELDTLYLTLNNSKITTINTLEPTENLVYSGQFTPTMVFS